MISRLPTWALVAIPAARPAGSQRHWPLAVLAAGGWRVRIREGPGGEIRCGHSVSSDLMREGIIQE